MKVFLLSLILSSFLSQSPILAFAETKSTLLVVTESVGKLGTLTVTSRQVQIGILLEALIQDSKNKNRSIEPLNLNAKEFPSEVTSFLLEQMLYLESQEFAKNEITDGELKGIVRRFFSAIEGSKNWSDLKPSESEVSELAKKKILAQKFLDFKSEAFTDPISESALKTYYDSNQNRFGFRSFDQVKDRIRVYLSKEKVSGRMKDWIDGLQKKYGARNYLIEQTKS